jgi:putative flippase GtrA
VETRTETLGERIRRFLRSSAVGIVATGVDYAVLAVFLNVLHFDASLAKIPALACGTATQFVGSRYFAFRAQRGRLGRQMKWFVLAEFCAFWLTVLVFRVAVRWMHIPWMVANMISGFVVYFGFSYPIWKRVFTVKPEDLGGEELDTSDLAPAPAEATRRAAG